MNLFCKIILTTLVFLLNTNIIVGQNVFIHGRLSNYHQSSVPFFKNDLRQSKDFYIQPISYTEDSFTFIFKNPRPQIFSLLLNRVFIEPADSVQFNFSFVDRINGSFYDSVFAEGRYPGNYMFYNYFKRWNDERPELMGNDSISLISYYNSLKSFYFNTITARQDSFTKEYPISKNFKHLLNVELPFTFLNTLLTSFKYASVKIPASLRIFIQNDIKYSNLNDTVLLDSESFVGFVNLYGAYFLAGNDHNQLYSFSKFKENIDHIKKYFSGLNEEFAIVNNTIMYSLRRTSYYDSAVDNYINDLTEKLTDTILKKSLVFFINTRSKVNSAAFDSLLLKSARGDTMLLKDVLSNRQQITLIDFWASWCGPCLEQDPFLADFYQQKNNIFYVAISIDEDPVAWLKSVKENQNGFVHQYIILNQAENEKLRDIIGLHVIPRYVLMDKQKQLAYLHASIPKNKQQLMDEVTLVERLSESNRHNAELPALPPPPPPMGKMKN